MGAGINALLSISDGSGPYVFYRKMEMTRPVRKQMEGKVFICRESRRFLFVDNVNKLLFFFLCLDFVNNYVYRQGKCTNRRNESTKTQLLFCFFGVLTILPSIISFSYHKYSNCKKQSDFHHKKDNSALIANHYFSHRKWQL